MPVSFMLVKEVNIAKTVFEEMLRDSRGKASLEHEF